MPIVGAFLVPHPPVILPEVGQGRERELQMTADSYQKVAREIAQLQPDTIVLFSPHSTMYADYIHISPGKEAFGSFRQYGAPVHIRAPYDHEFSAKLAGLCRQERIAGGTEGEKSAVLDHGTLVPLYFIQKAMPDYRLVRISPSGLSRRDHYRFGMLVRRCAGELDRRVVVVASGDLSHRLTKEGPYGYAPEGPVLDRAITEVLRSGDFGRLFELEESLCSKGGECGVLPLLMMAGALDGQVVQSRLLSYEGPFGVGYAVAAFTVGETAVNRNFLQELDRAVAAGIARSRGEESAPARLARETLEYYTREGSLPPFPESALPAVLGERAGVFVSIRKHGELRGCIGTTSPTRPTIADEIRYNAVSAGTRDPRFSPVQEEELELLTYSVDVLSPAEPAKREELDPVRYGVIVTSGAKRGLLLPNLDGVDTVDQQIDIAKRKADIRPGELCGLERFEVVRYR